MKKKLTSRQLTALQSLAAGASVGEAAAAACVSPRTCFRWMQIPGFHNELVQLQRQTMDHALHKLQAATAAAVDSLITNLDSKNEWVIQSAANSILSHAVRARELLDLARRIELLENQLTVLGGDQKWQQA